MRGSEMGRAAKYSDQQILDATLEIVAEDGAHAANVVAIAKRLGAPSGSIYHRFASRDLLLAALWIRTVKRFQAGFLDALAQHDTQHAGRLAVNHVLDWTGTHRSEAKILAMYRREDLIALWPDDLGDDLSSLNEGVKDAVTKFTRNHFGIVDAETLGRVQFALIEIPYAAVRHTLRGDQAPCWLSETVVAASMAVLEIGSSDA